MLNNSPFFYLSIVFGAASSLALLSALPAIASFYANRETRAAAVLSFVMGGAVLVAMPAASYSVAVLVSGASTDLKNEVFFGGLAGVWIAVVVTGFTFVFKKEPSRSGPNSTFLDH